MNGWINLDKPLDMTSARVVAKVKWLLYQLPKKDSEKRKIKIGHAGTLDPMASGILPLAVGKATKTVQYMMDAGKTYEFTVTWGQERATDDAEGEVTATSDNRPSEAEILAIIPQFIGDISQTPPNYSAIKLGGKRAYDLARTGQAMDIKSRQVFVKSLEIQKPTTDHRLLTTDFICYCGKGTYIRSLARDMGRVLGCYGYISALRRTQVGKFTESSAISLEILENMVHKGCLDFLLPVETPLDDILAWEAKNKKITI